MTLPKALDLDRLEGLMTAASPAPWTEDDGNIFSKARKKATAAVAAMGLVR